MVQILHPSAATLPRDSDETLTSNAHPASERSSICFASGHPCTPSEPTTASGKRLCPPGTQLTTAPAAVAPVTAPGLEPEPPHRRGCRIAKFAELTRSGAVPPADTERSPAAVLQPGCGCKGSAAGVEALLPTPAMRQARDSVLGRLCRMRRSSQGGVGEEPCGHERRTILSARRLIACQPLEANSNA